MYVLYLLGDAFYLITSTTYDKHSYMYVIQQGYHYLGYVWISKPFVPKIVSFFLSIKMPIKQFIKTLTAYVLFEKSEIQFVKRHCRMTSFLEVI